MNRGFSPARIETRCRRRGRKKCGLAAALLASLVLSGCAVADGVAYAVKEAQRGVAGNTNAAQPRGTAQPAATAPEQTPATPPPPPVPRESIKVEPLAPPPNS